MYVRLQRLCTHRESLLCQRRLDARWTTAREREHRQDVRDICLRVYFKGTNECRIAQPSPTLHRHPRTLRRRLPRECPRAAILLTHTNVAPKRALLSSAPLGTSTSNGQSYRSASFLTQVTRPRSRVSRRCSSKRPTSSGSFSGRRISMQKKGLREDADEKGSHRRAAKSSIQRYFDILHFLSALAT